MLTKAEIEALTTEIAAVYNPEKIYLFGSYAKDSANEDSDIDLLIVKQTDEDFYSRSSSLRSMLSNYPSVPVDLLIYTPDEFSRLYTNVVSMPKEAFNNGKLLYERA